MINNEDLLIKKVKDFIFNDNKLYKIFTHHKVKYSIDVMMKNILIILKTGISYRDIQKYTTINWNTIYKFNLKITKYNIFEKIFNKTIDDYLNEMNNNHTSYFTDTTFICNKLGEDLVSNNPQIKKHKTSKISVISDDFNIPLSIKFDSGIIHDSTIIKEQLLEMHQRHPQIFNPTNILIADGAYDSIPLQKLTGKLNLKKLVTNKNIRNLRDKVKIGQLKMNLYDKMLLRKRICVEHVINKYKKFKRIHYTKIKDFCIKYWQNKKSLISYFADSFKI